MSKGIFGKFYKDPSNENTKYLRTRVRNLKKSLEASGINYDQIFQSIKNLASSRDTLDLYFNKIYNHIVDIKKNKIYSFVSVLKSMGKSDGYLSFGGAGYTLVFDFPIYKNIHSTLDIIDEIVLNSGGRIYLAKDSRVNKLKFKKINKEFNNKNFINFRKKNKFFFSSLQSERLGI